MKNALKVLADYITSVKGENTYARIELSLYNDGSGMLDLVESSPKGIKNSLLDTDGDYCWETFPLYNFDKDEY